MTQEHAVSSSGWGSTSLRRPRAFWLGAVLVIAGVMLHLPMLFTARNVHYMLVDMSWDGYMLVGMPLIIAGLGITYYALLPLPRIASEQASVVRAAENTPLTRAQAGHIVVLLIAIAIDTIKPFTFTFILPSVAKEYNLSTPTHHLPGHLAVGLFPLAGITGTVIGSFVWGSLADRIGRRASILLSCVMFIATSMCGAMAPYVLNLVICFIMGMSVGGLLPIAYALLTETIPARYRGQVIVLVAGAGTALGFLTTSWFADWLIPTFGWRIMWFIGLPTGVLLIALQRYLPESPRFLAATGRPDEAQAVMRRLGLRIVSPELAEPEPALAETASKTIQLLRYPFRNLTIALAVAGIAWGLANFGFIVWLPTTIVGAGLSVTSITGILAKAALFAFPGSALMAWLYDRWSSKGTVVLAAATTGVVLLVFAILGNTIAKYPVLLAMALIFLLVAMWGLISVLAPYSAEVYPVRVRARGAGITAGSSKLGGVIALVMSVLVIVPFSVHDTALIAAVPALLGALAVSFAGVETSYARSRAVVASQAARQPE
jgi:MFS transporter, putative metabolite:H+ symporter